MALMKKNTLKIGKNDVSSTGRFQLKVNVGDPKKFRLTNINAFVPFGKSIEDKKLFMNASGFVETLIIDKIIISFNPDKSEVDRHNIETFLQHPDVKIGGYTDEQHAELVRLGIKKSNPRFTVTNIDKVADDKFESTSNLIVARAKLYDKKNPISKEKLVWLASSLGVPYRTEITDEQQYIKFLIKQLDASLQSSDELREKFEKALENIAITEFTFYINEMLNIGIIVDYAGIYKIKEQPVGSSLKGIMNFFESNQDVYNEHKKTVIESLQNLKIA